LQPIFDKPWHRKALAGDPQAIDRLAQDALEPLYRFCFYRLARNRHLCEEVVQETMLRAIRQLESYEPGRAGSDIFPWLVGLTRNEIRRVLSRENASASLETLWNRMDQELRAIYARLESEPLGDEVVRREETREMVGATMSQLSPRYRAVLEAKYVDGKSVRDMAAAGRTSEKAVESQLARARDAFRAAFLALARSLEYSHE